MLFSHSHISHGRTASKRVKTGYGNSNEHLTFDPQCVKASRLSDAKLSNARLSDARLSDAKLSDASTKQC